MLTVAKTVHPELVEGRPCLDKLGMNGTRSGCFAAGPHRLNPRSFTMLRHFLLAGLLIATPAVAKELKGVKMAETVEVDGKQVKLNGMGLRTKAIFKVY